MFCLNSDEYLRKTAKAGVAGSRIADAARPFTARDWEEARKGFAPQAGTQTDTTYGKPDESRGVKTADFERWFPNTDDLRVLDWLGAEAETDAPDSGGEEGGRRGRRAWSDLKTKDRGTSASAGDTGSAAEAPYPWRPASHRAVWLHSVMIMNPMPLQ